MEQPLPGHDVRSPLRLLSFAVEKAKVDPDARARRRVSRWLGQLDEIGAALAMDMRDIAPWRRTNGRLEAAGIDLELGWELVRRAMRWIAALQLRLAAEARAARVGMEPAERRDEAPEWDGDRLVRRLRAADLPRPIRPRQVRLDDCIDGRPMAEVVEQICADLDALATVLGKAEAGRQIEVIAAAARALLGEAEWALLPPPDVPGRAKGEPLTAGDDGARERRSAGPDAYSKNVTTPSSRS
jgi:hypothetical protein